MFLFREKRYTKALKTTRKDDADKVCDLIEETIRLVERGTITLPDDADIPLFFISGGALGKPVPVPQNSTLTFSTLLDDYMASIPPGHLEETTLYTAKIHVAHLKKEFGSTMKATDLDLGEVQSYVKARLKKVTVTTIKKELATGRAAWNWALRMGMVRQPFPKGVMYTKSEEKPTFQTWDQIERQIKLGADACLWDCLFLGTEEIGQLLAVVLDQAAYPFLYPMFVFAAHTGARRSEMIRSLRSDVDFVEGVVTIRERKRSQSNLTTRRVPLTKLLAQVLQAWFGQEESRFTFSLEKEQITRNTANYHFVETLKGTKWNVLKGWHVLRHSFASNCAATGTEQRIIDEWMGHQSEAMVQRYRHMFPDKLRRAIDQVFPGE